MSQVRTSSPNRSRAALASLSAVGAAIAGFGVGVLFAGPMAAVAWPAMIVGIVAHLVGMLGTIWVQASEDYRPSAVESASYWLCWAVILALLLYAGAELLK